MSKITQYQTPIGVVVTRKSIKIEFETSLNKVLGLINTHRGAIFASGYEYPGRYSRWSVGFVNPPIEIVAYGRKFIIRALNKRGVKMLKIFSKALRGQKYLVDCKVSLSTNEIKGEVIPMPETFAEEDRLRQPTIFTVLRTLVKALDSDEDGNLGFYGALGYDLVYQVEPITLRHIRPKNRPDMHLFLPDELYVTDHRLEQSYRYQYDFKFEENNTTGIRRSGEKMQFKPGVSSSKISDHTKGEYEEKVRKIIKGARAGDFFEVVLSQVFSVGCSMTSTELFKTIRRRNPSPYEFLINLGSEQLVGASPEMFVQVEGSRMETCPISGTIARGNTPLEDHDNSMILLNSEKDKAEITQCTDVDRNDKARVCKPGTIKVLGRRILEMYSRLIHTVDHVVGELREGCDAFDALLTQMWAGTLTGAPKPVAMQMIEDLENSARRWYGGCVGMFLFNGDMKTGITIRTVHLEDGVASVRAGSTLLAYSDPAEEEKETQIKASAFLDAAMGLSGNPTSNISFDFKTGVGKNVLFVDNRDSFVHMLSDYVRQTGAKVATYRAGNEGISFDLLDTLKPDLVFISPGPGRPDDFKVPELVLECARRKIPVFGVCLGLQGIVEAFGGELGVLDIPMHGVGSQINSTEKGILSGLFPEKEFTAGRYHSLYALKDAFPECLDVLAETKDGVIMAIQHKELPIAAVQFHPESIMTMGDNEVGLRLIAQVIKVLTNK